MTRMFQPSSSGITRRIVVLWIRLCTYPFLFSLLLPLIPVSSSNIAILSSICHFYPFSWFHFLSLRPYHFTTSASLILLFNLSLFLFHPSPSLSSPLHILFPSFLSLFSPPFCIFFLLLFPPFLFFSLPSTASRSFTNERKLEWEIRH